MSEMTAESKNAGSVKTFLFRTKFGTLVLLSRNDILSRNTLEGGNLLSDSFRGRIYHVATAPRHFCVENDSISHRQIDGNFCKATRPPMQSPCRNDNQYRYSLRNTRRSAPPANQPQQLRTHRGRFMP